MDLSPIPCIFSVSDDSSYASILISYSFCLYIFGFFIINYDPSSYQRQALLTENPYGDVGSIEGFDNIEFRDVYWPNDRSLKNSLFIGTEEGLPLRDINPDEAIIIKEIIFKNGKIAFRIVETYED